jgi:hypothetical protein
MHKTGSNRRADSSRIEVRATSPLVPIEIRPKAVQGYLFNETEEIWLYPSIFWFGATSLSGFG